jgi:hypothetical protein
VRVRVVSRVASPLSPHPPPLQIGRVTDIEDNYRRLRFRKKVIRRFGIESIHQNLSETQRRAFFRGPRFRTPLTLGPT